MRPVSYTHLMNLCAIAGISGAILMQTMDNRGINAIITFISNAFAGNIIPPVCTSS